MARGTMPKGLRDAGAYSIGYTAQMLAYLLLVTDRYPNADPTAMLAGVERPPLHPVHLVGDADDLRFSRVTVFFRLPLAIPHLVWLALWTVVAILAAIVTWFATLFTGTPPAGLHRFLSRYVRYSLHVNAFIYLAANPFPGFAGEEGRYPLDLELPGPAAAEPLEDRLPDLPRDPGAARQRRARRGAHRRRVPHVVRRARDRRCAVGPP